MKRSVIIAAFGVLLFAIGCQQGSNDQTATNANPPAPQPGGTTGAAPTASNASGYGAVQAIFDQNCMPCHSAQNHKNGLDLTSYEALMKGGEGGQEIVPGDPDKSLIVMYLTGAKKPQMPQKRAPLTPDQMKVITDWIKAGAKKA